MITSCIRATKQRRRYLFSGLAAHLGTIVTTLLPRRTTVPTRRAHASTMQRERKNAGEAFHFYGTMGVAAIRPTDDGIAIGDTVRRQGPSTNLEQTVETLQIEHTGVSRADPGQEVGMKVRERVREKDFVYKLGSMEVPLREPPAKAPSPKKAAPPKKAPAKKAPRKKAPVRRKASRAPRSKARR